LSLIRFPIGAWQGVAMELLKFYPGPPCSTLLRPEGVARLQSGRPAAIFYPFLDTPHGTPCASRHYDSLVKTCRFPRSAGDVHKISRASFSPLLLRRDLGSLGAASSPGVTSAGVTSATSGVRWGGASSPEDEHGGFEDPFRGRPKALRQRPAK
jgi:hypothetical protein